MIVRVAVGEGRLISALPLLAPAVLLVLTLTVDAGDEDEDVGEAADRMLGGADVGDGAVGEGDVGRPDEGDLLLISCSKASKPDRWEWAPDKGFISGEENKVSVNVSLCLATCCSKCCLYCTAALLVYLA